MPHAPEYDNAFVPLRFSHVGLYVHDLPTMEWFYTDVLGFTVTDRGVVRGNDIVFTTWDPTEHHQVALIGGRPDTSGFNHINQLSFRVEAIEDIQSVWLKIKDEPSVRDVMSMDHGNAWALYFRDPEGNRIEIFCDSEWYIPQPCAEPLDLSLPASLIRARSEAFCRNSPGFMSAQDYRSQISERIRDRLRA